MSTRNGHDGFDDDSPTPVGPPVGHVQNREMLAIIGNYALEARAHGQKLESLYEALRTLDRPMPRVWGQKLLEEEERHHTANIENLERLRKIVET